MKTISLSHLVVLGLAASLASSIPQHVSTPSFHRKVRDILDERDVDQGLDSGTDNYGSGNEIAIEDLTYPTYLNELAELNEKLAQTEEELVNVKNGTQQDQKTIDDLLERLKGHQDKTDKIQEEKQQLCDIVDCHDETAQQLCRPYNCNSVDGGFSQWSAWQEVGSWGDKLRERTCDHPTPAYGGNNCSGDFNETQACGCDVIGSESPSCSDSWMCTCKAEYQGDKCDSCIEGYEKFETECIDVRRVDNGATVVFEVVTSEIVEWTLKSTGIEGEEIPISSDNTGLRTRNDEGYGVEQKPFSVEKLQKGGKTLHKLTIGNVLPAYAGRVEAMIGGKTSKAYHLVVAGIWSPLPFRTYVSPGEDIELKVQVEAKSDEEKWFRMKYLGELRWEEWKEITNDNRYTIAETSNDEEQNVFTLTITNVTKDDNWEGYQLQVGGVKMTSLIHTCYVELFEDASYGGEKDTYTSNGNVVPGNKASSLKVAAGCCVDIFKYADFGGESKTFCESTGWLSYGWNDVVSSVKLYSGEGD